MLHSLHTSSHIGGYLQAERVSRKLGWYKQLVAQHRPKLSPTMPSFALLYSHCAQKCVLCTPRAIVILEGHSFLSVSIANFKYWWDQVGCRQLKIWGPENYWPFVTHEDSFIFSLYFYKERAKNNDSKEHCSCIKRSKQIITELLAQPIDS